MSKCSQCDKPAVFTMGGQDLCIPHASELQSILDRQIAHFRQQGEEALDQMEMVTGVRLRPRRPPPVNLVGPTFHNINIKNSTVGVVQSGGSLSQVDITITALNQAGEKKLAEAFKTLSEAAIDSSTLDEKTKTEAVQILGALSREAVVEGERQQGPARALLQRLREIMGLAADAARTGSAFGDAIDAISTAFGL